MMAGQWLAVKNAPLEIEKRPEEQRIKKSMSEKGGWRKRVVGQRMRAQAETPSYTRVK